jgi:diguanylate cyclase (GGDEF)-like protein
VSAVLLIALGAGLALLASAAILAYLSKRSDAGHGARRRSSGSAPGEEERRLRQVALFAGSVEPDEVVSRVLQAATSLVGADAAAISLHLTDAQPPVVKTLNLTPDEAMPLLGAWRPTRRTRPVTMKFRVPSLETSGGASAVQAAAIVPLRGERDDPLGALGVFWRRPVEEVQDEDIGALEDLAASAERALSTALRFRELQELAVRDPLTGLYNRRYFDETLAAEVKRAHRYDRQLALIFMDLDDFKAINEELGHLGGDAVLVGIAERLRSVIRAADIAARVGGDEFAVILPESSTDDAQRLFRRLQTAIENQPIARAKQMCLSGGIADLGRDDDDMSFFERADRALYRAKRTGKGRMVAAGENE